MIVRRLNDEGIRQMQVFLDSLTTDTPIGYPDSILTDAATSDDLPVQIDVAPERRFARRFEAAEYLYRALAPLRHPLYHHIERDRGVWAWLSLLWFDQLCPEEHGRRRPGELARWVPSFGDARRYYRHLLFGPYAIYCTHHDRPERALCLFCQPLHVVGHIYYQLASCQNLITSAPVTEVATSLYYDARLDGLRRGSQTHGAEGSVFRFAAVLMQFDRTFDLHTIPSDRLLHILPDEFRRFRGR